MSDFNQKEKLIIRFSGDRFEPHTFPLTLLEDIRILNEMILDVASEMYRERHEKHRVPRKFRENHELSLSEISKGSTVLSIVSTPRMGQTHLFDTDEEECIQDAIRESVSFMRTGNSAYSGTIRSRMRTLGSKLRDDEKMEFRYGNETAVYDQEQRRRLMGSEEPVEVYDSVYGRVTMVDSENDSFRISTVPNVSERRLDLRIDQIPDDVPKPSCAELFQNKVVVTGSFLDKGDGSRRVSSMESLEILDPMDVGYRLVELSSLEPGWGEYGDEVPPDRDALMMLMDLFDVYGSDLKSPYIFPTVDGGLMLEWDSKEALDLELDLETMTGILTAGDEELSVDLRKQDDWKRIASMVNSHALR